MGEYTVQDYRNALSYKYAVDAKNSNLGLEIIAMLFYEDTGVVAPFKSAPMHCPLTNDERIATYDEWRERINAIIADAVAPILAVVA